MSTKTLMLTLVVAEETHVLAVLQLVSSLSLQCVCARCVRLPVIHVHLRSLKLACKLHVEVSGSEATLSWCDGLF